MLEFFIVIAVRSKSHTYVCYQHNRQHTKNYRPFHHFFKIQCKLNQYFIINQNLYIFAGQNHEISIVMEQFTIEIPVQQFRLNELSDEEKFWIETAVISSKQAYAPYSEFNVGAAVVLANGQIVTGNNQENAAYPSGLCAERVALFYAGARYPDVPVKAMVVVATKNEVIQPYISPCGSCRQVLLETEKRYQQPVRILLCGNDKVYAIDSAESLLPLSFSAENL